MSKKTFFIRTFGCQMNEHDSEILAGMLTEMGLIQVVEQTLANIVIINTCSVRENADKRFFGTLGQLKKKKEEDAEFIVCVCGCMMQQQYIIDKLKAKYPWVDIVFGTNNIHEFPKLLKKTVKDKQRLVSVHENRGEIVEGLPVKRLYKHKALVNIMYGCDNFCTYCIVPYTRGRERSRRPEDIMREVRALTEDGVKEIMLLGQNVNSYKGSSDTDFTDLIWMISEIDGLERLRFMTSHPKDLSDSLIEAFRYCEKLCPAIHLPVQSGSNEILKRMNRRYSKEYYLHLIDGLRAAVPNITITTDIIVGFPGETENDFQETLDLVRKARFDSAFTFLYSIRHGTPAAEYDDQISEEVKHERFNRLTDLINKISAEKNAAYEGCVEKVLVEGISKQNSNIYSGRTPGFKLVNFPAGEDSVGEIVDVKITDGKTFSLTGMIV